MNNPAKEFNRLTVSCFDVSLTRVRQEFELTFMEHRMNVSGQRTSLAFEEFVPDPRAGGARPTKALLFTPGAVNTTTTAMITNLSDGWQTLATLTSARLSCSCWQFTICREVEFPRTAFTWIEAGVVRRTVSAQLDTQWIFFEQGAPLEVEDQRVYKKKRIADRVTSEHVFSVAQKLGYPIAHDEFWTTDESSVVFSGGGRAD